MPCDRLCRLTSGHTPGPMVRGFCVRPSDFTQDPPSPLVGVAGRETTPRPRPRSKRPDRGIGRGRPRPPSSRRRKRRLDDLAREDGRPFRYARNVPSFGYNAQKARECFFDIPCVPSSLLRSGGFSWGRTHAGQAPHADGRPSRPSPAYPSPPQPAREHSPRRACHNLLRRTENGMPPRAFLCAFARTRPTSPHRAARLTVSIRQRGPKRARPIRLTRP